MAENGYFQNNQEEYEKGLDNHFRFDAVLDAFGDEPITEYVSYRQVDEWMRSRILNWLRTKDFYYDEILGLDEEGEQDDEEEEKDEEEEEEEQDEEEQQQDNDDTELANVYALENRIKNLEDLFQQIKVTRENQMEERSGSNKVV